MDAGELALVALAVAAVIGVVGLLFALGAAIRTMAVFRRSVQELTSNALPLIEDMHAAVRQTNADLMKVDALIDRADSISTTVNSVSRLAYTAFSSPVVKVLALWTGTARAIGGFRFRRHRGARHQALSAPRPRALRR